MILLDAGHGGYVRNKYVTPGKRFKHESGFHDNGWFYEGVWNRTFTDMVADRLKDLKIPFMKIYHPSTDTSLTSRVRMANTFNAKILISNHANAANGRARGWEVFSSNRKDKSDEYARMYADMYDVSAHRNRGHKEANFTILTTRCPSILVEHGFFDNFDDASLLFNKDHLDYIVDLQVKFIQRI